ncbi:DUF1566 domain-containing protein [Hydrogenophaga sp. RWCD_12]|uniref:DUF1566 domain-containing protein n=1 Tax=Hydrogenophaga sp. RWCD_12 TaxID=3391190 RepID=UPI0039852428
MSDSTQGRSQSERSGQAGGEAGASGAPDATLTARSLAQAEVAAKTADTATPLQSLLPGTIASRQAYALGDVARKALALRISVHRFFNSRTAAHFYTTSETEKANVIATMPFMTYDGPAFSGARAFSPGLSPVHRFYNRVTGVHFYTISEAERAQVATTLPQYTYEGVAYHASQVAGQGLVPLYRFFVPGKGFHFYTASESEKTSIQANLSATYSYEGVGYYVLDSNWTAEKLPHTGITSSQCYIAGSDTLVECSPRVPPLVLTALDLNPQQDGHRGSVNPMTYSAVYGVLNGFLIRYPETSCVLDRVTGLIWEGKTTSGLRSWSHIYTNTGSNAADDTGGYVAAVNAESLCGYNDWRLPSAQELQGIVDYSKATAPKINSTWFPNTLAPAYWSAAAAPVSYATRVSFGSDGGALYSTARSNALAVRLVRGASPLGSPRFSYSSVAYPGDAANNLVNDAWTGLQWRRCVEGMSWNGAACTGPESWWSHEAALAYAKGKAGWRLPNVKELGSLMDLRLAAPPFIDQAAFPQTGSLLGSQSSTPNPSVENPAWTVFFDNGNVLSVDRVAENGIRLVRINP